MKHVFIINPISGLGNVKDVAGWVHEYFEKCNESYEIRFTESVGHAQRIASEYTEAVILYSVGGDGTAHEILNGMNFDSQLAIIPVGTGNDFWRMIAADKKNIKDVLYRTIEGEVHNIDIGIANGHYFLNCLNIGVDADVNKRVNAVRTTIFPRSLVYIYNAVIALAVKKKTHLDITMNGKTQRFDTLLTSVMNGKWYGGGFKSAPLADIEDGLLDVTIVSDVPFWRLPKLFPMYYKGNHLGLDVVETQKVTELHIHANHPVAVGYDGEVFEYTDIAIKVLQGKLKFRMPVGNNT
ncbi:diacylglycerol/lipid kinase family protein [Erysipelothrix aquatica]|uniref:diacylglycerol/lipid kinase family protein n=1 Tax=Erysipelothrix aquatica TaxID=2683714 RepID=UPI001357C214|nr:diacylglycerol kinase family protein [Erysipelothrix aquatica]